MQEVLRYLQSVEGVIGVAVFNDQGSVIESAFPALIDAATLQRAAHQSLDLVQGLQIDQSFELVDLRYAEGRILIKRITGCMVYLLCSKTINLHIIATNLNLAAHKIETARSAGSTPVAPVAIPPAMPAGQQEELSDPSILTLQISHLANREASASFDSLGMVAVSQATAQYISSFYKQPFKKLVLTVSASGKSGTFPAMVMKDMEAMYDGTIIVGPGIEKKLAIAMGDKVQVGIA